MFQDIKRPNILNRNEIAEQIRNEIHFLFCYYKSLIKLLDKINRESSDGMIKNELLQIRSNIDKAIERANALSGG